MPEEPKKSGLIAAEIHGRELTPLYSNRFFVTATPGTTRIAFGEYITGNPDTDTIYHAAMVIPTEDARGLALLLLKIIQENDALNTQLSAAGNG